MRFPCLHIAALVFCSLLFCAYAQTPQAGEAASDWNEVKKLLSGVEVRLTETGGKRRNVAVYEVRDDSLVVIEKKQQSAIPREVIERIELKINKNDRRTQPAAQTQVKTAPDGRPYRESKGGLIIRSEDSNYYLVYRRTPK